MKGALVILLLAAICYQASAAGRGNSCPALMEFYDDVIECAEVIPSARTQSQLCGLFNRRGPCRDIYTTVNDNCFPSDPVHRQLDNTMEQVKMMCPSLPRIAN